MVIQESLLINGHNNNNNNKNLIHLLFYKDYVKNSPSSLILRLNLHLNNWDHMNIVNVSLQSIITMNIIQK